MNQAKAKKESLTLLFFKEIKVLIDYEYANFKMGYDDNFILLSLINKENKYYESKFSLKEIQHIRNESFNNIISISFFLYSLICFEEYILRYKENKTEVLLEINGIIPKQLILKLKTNEEDKIVINNKDKLKLIDDFNIKYSCKIKVNESVLELKNRKINNQGFKELCNLNLNLIILNLDCNKITDLTPIKNNENFKCLNKLSLSQNNLIDIKPLYHSYLNNLEDLNLSHNKINDISVLEGMKMNKLIRIYLNDNNISDIKSFEKINCEQLLKLNLSTNNICKITPLEKASFGKLIELDLSKNNITDISSFEKMELGSLEVLDLSFNEINEIFIQKKISFPKLNKLILNNNNIKEIKIDGRLQLGKLYKIDLMQNDIEKIIINKDQQLNRLQIINLTKNKIEDILFLI